MSFEQNWEHFFKPEARSSGRSLFTKGTVHLIQPSDTEVQAYVRGSTPIKIFFKADSVESAFVRVGCSCPNGKKGQFCKHIWATLLQIENSKPDFLEGKREIDCVVGAEASGGKPAFARTESPERVAAQEAQKNRQNDYRKEQYQKQKLRLKEKKTEASGRVSKFAPPSLPNDITSAIEYFAANGISFEQPLDAAQVQHAKKILSRVFHPDKGGSHQEILELNQNCDTLLSFIGV